MILRFKVTRRSMTVSIFLYFESKFQVFKNVRCAVGSVTTKEPKEHPTLSGNTVVFALLVPATPLYCVQTAFGS